MWWLLLDVSIISALFTLDLHVDLEPYSEGKYYNEAETDMSPQKWKSAFWGEEGDMYTRILRIKQTWDPNNKFTCHQCVGSDTDTTSQLLGKFFRKIKKSLRRFLWKIIHELKFKLK